METLSASCVWRQCWSLAIGPFSAFIGDCIYSSLGPTLGLVWICRMLGKRGFLFYFLLFSVRRRYSYPMRSWLLECFKNGNKNSPFSLQFFMPYIVLVSYYYYPSLTDQSALLTCIQLSVWPHEIIVWFMGEGFRHSWPRPRTLLLVKGFWSHHNNELVFNQTF